MEIRGSRHERPNVSIAIRTLGLEKVPEIISKLSSQSDAININEVVILDGSIDDESIDLFAKTCNKFTFRIKRANAPFSYPDSLNQIVKISRSEFVVILSGHSVPIGSDWLEAIVKPFENEKCGAVCGGQVCENGACTIEMMYRQAVFGIPMIGKAVRAFNASHVAIRKSVWRATLFDIRVPYGEDRKWALEIERLGWIVDRNFQAKAYHSHDYSNFQALRYVLKQSVMASKLIIRDAVGA